MEDFEMKSDYPVLNTMVYTPGVPLQDDSDGPPSSQSRTSSSVSRRGKESGAAAQQETPAIPSAPSGAAPPVADTSHIVFSSDSNSSASGPSLGGGMRRPSRRPHTLAEPCGSRNEPGSSSLASRANIALEGHESGRPQNVDNGNGQEQSAASRPGPERIQWSAGAELHHFGQCRPCVWNWKQLGCDNGDTCAFCHLCGYEALNAKHKENRQAGKAERARAAKERHEKEGASVRGFQKGVVKAWYDDKGMGFIMPSKGGEYVFVHRTALAGQAALVVGTSVEYELGWDNRRSKEIVKVCKIAAASADPTVILPTSSSEQMPHGPDDRHMHMEVGKAPVPSRKKTLPLEKFSL